MRAEELTLYGLFYRNSFALGFITTDFTVAPETNVWYVDCHDEMALMSSHCGSELMYSSACED
jgi:hypothetical protein